MPGALGEFGACFDPNFPFSRGKVFLGWDSWDTQPNCVDSFNKATDPFAPSFFDLLLGFSASPCLKKHVLPHTHPTSDLWFWHTGGCSNLHDGVSTFFVTARNCAPFVCRAFLSAVLMIFLTLHQSWPSNLVREKTIVLFVSDHCTSLLVLVCCDWNYMSLLLNIVHVFSTENTLPLSSQRRLSFLFDTWWLIIFPQLCSRLWSFEFSSSDQFEVLQMSSIVDYLFVHCFEQFLGRTKPTQSEAEQSLVILTCAILPGSHRKANRLLKKKKASSHRTSKSWTSSFCKSLSEGPCTASKAQVARKCS